MFRDTSQPSVMRSVQGTSETSVFDKQRPQELESVRVEVQRGAVLTGRARDEGAHVRTYDITVEPGGHVRKAKDIIREGAKPPSLDTERRPSLPEGLSNERFFFRRERVRRFKVGSHFPALVASPRIVPPWRPSPDSTSASSTQPASVLSPRAAQQEVASQLTRPTVSNSQKHQVKRCEESPRPWLVSGVAGAGELISDRKPALYEEKYDSPRTQQREDYRNSKNRWVGESTILPANKATCRATCNSTYPVLQSHIAAVRERGRALNESLHERYQEKRETFQRELKDRGPLSSFERRIEAMERAEEEARRASVHKEISEAKPAENPMAGFKGLVSLKK